jgi:hypothetical protein
MPHFAIQCNLDMNNGFKLSEFVLFFQCKSYQLLKEMAKCFEVCYTIVKLRFIYAFHFTDIFSSLMGFGKEEFNDVESFVYNVKL